MNDAHVTGPLADALNEATRCIQCGFCLPACPTYKVFGEEKHSPRGRIRLVKEWAEGNTEPDESLLIALDLCLDCRACETACPIDVKYSTVLTGARDELANRDRNPRTAGPIKRLGRAVFRGTLRHIVARPGRVSLASRLTNRVLHSSVGRSLQRRLQRRSESGWLGAALTFAEAVPNPKQRDSEQEAIAQKQAPSPASPPSTATGAKRVHVFLGCAQQGMFPRTNEATAQLLHEAGYSVDIPPEQRCCGALHRHHGDTAFARRLVMDNLHAFDAFDERNDEPVVMNAGGCMAFIKEAADLFEPGTKEHDAALRLAARTRDVSEMLEPAKYESEKPLKVIYQPSCHLTNVCRVTKEPLAMLQKITGGNASLPADGGFCCGSAGIYNALHPEESRMILDEKMASIAADPPDVIVTSNPGCQLQMAAGVRAHGLQDEVRVMQWADFVRVYGRKTKNKRADESGANNSGDLPAGGVKADL